MIDFYRQERTVTTVRHVVSTPVNWAEVQKLLRVAVQDAGAEWPPSDDQFWYETGDDELAICCELTTGTITSGGRSNPEKLP